MLRKINRSIQNWMRPKRLALGKYIWDRKDKKIACFTGKIIEKNNIKSILFLRYDGKIGDMVVNTLMFREIKKVYPEIKIGVVTRGAAIDIIKNNPYVDKIYKYEKETAQIKKLAYEIAEESYDLLIDFSEMLRVKEMMFINLCKARINIGLDKKEWNLFEVFLEGERDFKWNDHITARYKAYLEKLGIENPDLNYDVYIDENKKIFIKNFLLTIKEKKKVVLNPYGASSHRSFSQETLKFIAEYIAEKNAAVIIIFPPDKKNYIEDFTKKSHCKSIYFIKEAESVQDSAALIEKADLVITPDTSIVHIASAFNKRLIAVYKKDNALSRVNQLVWAPNGENYEMLLCEEDINSFDRETMKKAVDKFLEEN